MEKLTLKYLICAFISSVLLTSCLRNEDPGPLQNDHREFAIEGFDRIRAGEALDITLVEGTSFSVFAQGDSRNLDDLEMNFDETSLEIKFNKERNRQYTTYLTITMPILRKVDFSGAISSRAAGFNKAGEQLEVALSGASNFELDGASEEITVQISGASKATIKGNGKKLGGTISGASLLSAFDFAAEEGDVDVSGASKAWVNVSQNLNAVASGASEVIYRGSATVHTIVSGASTIRAD